MSLAVRRFLVILVGSALLLFGGVSLNKYFASFKKQPPRKEVTTPQRYVPTQVVSYSNQNAMVTSYGRVVSSNSLMLSSEVSGKMLEGAVKLKDGSGFRKGQLLFHVYDEDVKLALKARKSGFLNRIALVIPDIKFDYPESLIDWEQYFNSLDIDQPLPELPEFKSTREKTFIVANNILGEYYGIKSDEERLKKYKVYAPFTGSIASAYLEPGSVVSPGARIADIIRNGAQELELPINSEVVPYIGNGMKVSLSDTRGNGKWTGSIIRIGDVLDPQTQSVNIFVRINQDSRYPLYDGAYLKAVIEGKTLGAALELSRKAFVTNNQVNILREDSTLELKDVAVLFSGEDVNYITGLDEGVKILTEPVTMVRKGMKFISISEK